MALDRSSHLERELELAHGMYSSRDITPLAHPFGHRSRVRRTRTSSSEKEAPMSAIDRRTSSSVADWLSVRRCSPLKVPLSKASLTHRL